MKLDFLNPELNIISDMKSYKKIFNLNINIAQVFHRHQKKSDGNKII
jgi:hypothetical protein